MIMNDSVHLLSESMNHICWPVSAESTQDALDLRKPRLMAAPLKKQLSRKILFSHTACKMQERCTAGCGCL